MNLSIKNVSEITVQRLRERAARGHRSLQGELLDIVEKAANERGSLTSMELLDEVRRLGVSTPADSVNIIRAARDGR